MGSVLLLAAVGLLFYGVAMLRSSDFGALFGWMSIAFGIAGLYAANSGLIEQTNMIAIGMFALVFFHIIIGLVSVRRR